MLGTAFFGTFLSKKRNKHRKNNGVYGANMSRFSSFVQFVHEIFNRLIISNKRDILVCGKLYPVVFWQWFLNSKHRFGLIGKVGG
ncbi:MAG: hypothetical protein RSB06_01260, partial [Clostridia bacterium]